MSNLVSKIGTGKKFTDVLAGARKVFDRRIRSSESRIASLKEQLGNAKTQIERNSIQTKINDERYNIKKLNQYKEESYMKNLQSRTRTGFKVNVRTLQGRLREVQILNPTTTSESSKLARASYILRSNAAGIYKIMNASGWTLPQAQRTGSNVAVLATYIERELGVEPGTLNAADLLDYIEKNVREDMVEELMSKGYSGYQAEKRIDSACQEAAGFSFF